MKTNFYPYRYPTNKKPKANGFGFKGVGIEMKERPGCPTDKLAFLFKCDIVNYKILDTKVEKGKALPTSRNSNSRQAISLRTYASHDPKEFSTNIITSFDIAEKPISTGVREALLDSIIDERLWLNKCSCRGWIM